MELRELLGEELFAQVDAKIQEHNSTITDKTKQVRYADLSERNYVSREKYDSRVTELTGVRQQLTDANATKEFLLGKGFRSQLARKAALTGMMELKFKDGKFLRIGGLSEEAEGRGSRCRDKVQAELDFRYTF